MPRMSSTVKIISGLIGGEVKTGFMLFQLLLLIISGLIGGEVKTKFARAQ